MLTLRRPVTPQLKRLHTMSTKNILPTPHHKCQSPLSVKKIKAHSSRPAT